MQSTSVTAINTIKNNVNTYTAEERKKSLKDGKGIHIDRVVLIDFCFFAISAAAVSKQAMTMFDVL